MAKITMREAIPQALMEEMDRDPAVFIMGEEVGVWGGTYAVTKGFYDKYGPDRIKDTPIAENAIIGAAIGAAMVGQRPIAELMTINFAFSAMDYIVNQAPKLRYMFGGQFSIPMVIRAVGGGGRQLGATHSQTPDAIFAHFPGLKVVSPGTPEDAKGLLKSAIRSDDPILFIEHATMYQVRGDVPDGEYLIPIGESKVQREGTVHAEHRLGREPAEPVSEHLLDPRKDRAQDRADERAGGVNEVDDDQPVRNDVAAELHAELVGLGVIVGPGRGDRGVRPDRARRRGHGGDFPLRGRGRRAGRGSRRPACCR